MNAILYIIVRQYINRVKGIFSKPLSAIITVIAVLCFSGGPLVYLLAPIKGKTALGSSEVIIACVQLFIGIILISSSLSQQSGLFTNADANLLFCSPMTKRTILLYTIIQSAPASILTAVFVCFYLPFFIGSEMTLPGFILTLLVTSLLIYCIFIIYYYIYIQDAGCPGLKKRLKKIYLAVIAAAFAVFAIVFINNDFNIGIASEAFFKSPFYNAFPVLGWAKWAVASLLNGQYLTGFIPAILLLTGFILVMSKLYYSLDVDFYEKAQMDSLRFKQLADNVKSNGYDSSGLSLKKVHNVKAVFRPGAAALLSRQTIEMKKKGAFSFNILLTGTIYIIMGLANGWEFYFIFYMMLFGLVIDITNDSWNRELRMPYIYLIPASSFKKLIYSVIPGFIKSLSMAVIIVAAAAIVYGVNPISIPCYILQLISYAMLFTAAGILSYRILGSLSNVFAQMFLKIIFMIFTAMPGAIIAAIIFAGTGSLGLYAAALPISIINAATALLLLFLSRGILENSELMK